MKITKIITAGALTSALILAGTQAFAAENDQENSTATVKFSENTKPTDPKDPQDPTKPVDPQNPDQPQTTGQAGPLSLDVVPSFDFGTQAVDLAGATYSAGTSFYKNYLQVTDNRTDKNGWTITVKRSAFTDTTTGVTITGTSLTIPEGTVRNVIPNADQNNVNGATEAVDKSQIVSAKVDLADDQEATIFGTKVDSAAVGKATTTSLLGETTDAQGNTNVTPATLNVPAGAAKAGEYTATLTWTTTASVFS